MAKADVFVILTNCQFEKNGYQNRAKVFGKWWTNPVVNGMKPIKDKSYTTGHKLMYLNMDWIWAIAKTLDIDTGKIKNDTSTKTGTERIVELCQYYKCDKYLTNPEAMDKYLDEKLLNDNGITVIPFIAKSPIHVFESFDAIGIEKTRNICKT